MIYIYMFIMEVTLATGRLSVEIGQWAQKHASAWMLKHRGVDLDADSDVPLESEETPN